MIGGLVAGVDMVGEGVDVDAVGLRCVVRAEMRVVGDEAGMRGCFVCAMGVCTVVVRILRDQSGGVAVV